MTRRFAPTARLDTDRLDGWGTRRRRARRDLWRPVARWAGILGTAVIAAAWFVTLRPPTLGGSAMMLIVRGTSMEPALHSGDLVIARRNATYGRGEVIAFRVPEGEAGAGSVLIHRIVGGDGTAGYTTQGDNSPASDPWLPTDADVIGSQRWHLPAVGGIGDLLRSAGTISVLTGLVAGSLVYSSLRPTPDPTHSRRRSSAASRPILPAVQGEARRRLISGWDRSRRPEPRGTPPPVR